jgi:shikimate kinase
MKLTRTVALVGMMAQQLGVEFKDADSEIEAAAGCSISQIFERYGEPAFRDGERKVIGRLLTEPPHVMATGGGAFMDPDTRAKLKANAVTIWLRVPIEVLLARTQRRDTRPLLRTGNPRETLERLLAERTPIYQEADYTLDSEDGPHAASVERIIGLLTECGACTP